MNTYLPYADYVQAIATLDTTRLVQQKMQALILLRSLAHVYPIKPNRDYSGFEKHTVGKFWTGYELQLAKYFQATCNELLNRKLPQANSAEAYKRRREEAEKAATLIEFMEDLEFVDTLPPLIGDEDFHSGMRACLLYRDVQSVTFKQWKNGVYPDHITTRSLPPKKASWKRDYFERIWDHFGQPKPVHFGQFGWEEKPDDMRLFYSLDKKPQMKKEEERKKERPYVSYLRPR